MDYSKLTKKQVINGIKKGKIELKSLSKEQKEDEDIVFEAVREKGSSLYYASKVLRDNKDIVLEAIRNEGLSLEYASERLKDSEKVVLEAIKDDYYILKYATERIQNKISLLEILEKQNTTWWIDEDKDWYEERMQVLANIRRQEDKEFLEKSINASNKVSKKVKF